jgi:hypothetical protein
MPYSQNTQPTSKLPDNSAFRHTIRLNLGRLEGARPTHSTEQSMNAAAVI